MSALRFKVGEIALLYSTHTRAEECPPQGTEVEVIEVGPFAPGHVHTVGGRLVAFRVAHDYIVDCPDTYAACVDSELRKRRPPIPDAVLETFKTKDRAVPA